MDFREFKEKYQKIMPEEVANSTASEPMVSICVQTYQHADFIKDCLDGILMQETDFPFEILLGEDASTDGTREICKEYAQKYPDKIRLFLHHRENNIKINGQPTGRFNFLYNLYSAKGKYVALCEGDDYWTDPLKLQKQVDFLDANQDYGLCFHAVNLLTKKGELIEDFITRVPEDPESIGSLARYGNYIHTPSVLFRNSFKDIPFEFFHVTFGDYFLYMMIAQEVGKIKYLPEVMGVYRHGVGIISRKSELALANSNILLYSCMISYVKEEDIKKILLQRQTDVLLRHYNQIQKKYKGAFTSNHFLFKKIKFFQTALRRFRMKQNEN